MGRLQSLAVAIQCNNAVALKTTCTQCTSLITNYVHIKEGGSMPLFTARASACNWQLALKRVRNGLPASKWVKGCESGRDIYMH